MEKIYTVEKYYEILELLFNTMPYVFWKDLDGRYQGANQNQAHNLGFSSPAEFIGKTIFEILKNHPDSAKLIDEIDNKIMTDDVSLISEEKIVSPSGEKTYLSQKSPLHNEKGEVIGMLGFSMDITELKQKEEIIKRERDRLINIAAQVAHDIRSPTASLLMLVKACTDIPEKERIALREAAMSIQDIANNLLTQYQQKDIETISGAEERQPMLLSANLLQIMAGKKLQCNDLPIRFDYEFSQLGSFAFIKMEPTHFKRMISNIINNAVEAIDSKNGEIILKLDTNNEWVKVIIQDNGKGMLPEFISKILNNISITAGKKDGYGLGLLQVRETLQRNQGEIFIESKVAEGTKIILTFPRISAPGWISDEIKLGSHDTIIILDDDTSIHGAWDARFSTVLNQNSALNIKHFHNGTTTLDYINSLTPEEKEKIFLLTDYELLKQELNGLDIIEKSQISRSILVTSHYANKGILERAMAANTKILPKQLASEVPIKILEAVVAEAKVIKNVDIVMVDDNPSFAEAIVSYLEDKRSVDYYQNPFEFLKQLEHYSKNTKICLDNDFKIRGMDGVKLAKQLHSQGYKNIYLLSGRDFEPGELPEYITFIMKTDLESIEKL